MKVRNNTMELVKWIECDVTTVLVEVEAEKLDGSDARKISLIEWGKDTISNACYGYQIPDYGHIGKRFTKAQNDFITAVIRDTVMIEETKRIYENAADIGYHAVSVFVDFWMNCSETDAKFTAYYALINGAHAGLIGGQLSKELFEQVAPYYKGLTNADRQQLEALHAALCEMDIVEETDRETGADTNQMETDRETGADTNQMETDRETGADTNQMETVVDEDFQSMEPDTNVYSKREILYNLFCYQFSHVYAALGTAAFKLTGFRAFSQFAASLWEVVEKGGKPEKLVDIPDPVGEHMREIWRDVRTAYKYTIERMTDITDDTITADVMAAANQAVSQVIDSNVMEPDEKACTIELIVEALTAYYPAYAVVGIHEHLSDKYQQGGVDFILEALDRLRDVLIEDGNTPDVETIPETPMDILPVFDALYTNDSPNILYKELVLNQFYSSYSYISRAYEIMADAMKKGILSSLWYRLVNIMNNSFSMENPAEWEEIGNNILSELETLLTIDDEIKPFARACVLDWMYYGMLSMKVSGVVPSAIMEAAETVTAAVCGETFAPETSAGVITQVWECVIRDGYNQREMKERIESLLRHYKASELYPVKEALARLYQAILGDSQTDGITYGELYNTAVGGAYYWKQQAMDESADDEERAYIETMWKEAIICYNFAPLVGVENAANVLSVMVAAVNTCGMEQFQQVPMLLLREGLDRVARYAARRVLNGSETVPETILKAAQAAEEAVFDGGLSSANVSTVVGYVWDMVANDVEKLVYYSACIDNVISTYSKSTIKQVKKSVKRLETAIHKNIPPGGGNNW